MSIRVPVAGLAPGACTLSPENSRHLCTVLRLRAGDTFLAFDAVQHTEARGVIETPSPDAARVTLFDVQSARVTATTALVLVYALSKGDKVDAVVRDATELGATRVVIARTAHAVVKVDEARAAAKVDRWRRIAEQAARQCGRADPPTVEGVFGWRDALEVAAGETSARYCLWEKAEEPLGPSLASALASRAGLAFAIGPEGGLSASEVDEAHASGFAPMSLGSFVLRTETVAAAVLGAVRIFSGA